jgi:acetyl-CoA C-acetyltransferase
LKRAGLAADKVQTLVLGNVIQAGVKMNPARQAGIGGGLPVEVPALTVNRVCGSGAQAVASAALEIWGGMIDCAVAGGMENMDRAPYLLPQGRWGARMGDVTMLDSMLYDGLNDAFSGQHSGWHTEDLAAKCAVSREAQDRWALRSQQQFSAAQAAGKFDAEIVPIEIKSRKGAVSFAKDEHNRPDTTIEGFAKLPKVFKKDGVIHPGAASGICDGGASAVMATRTWADKKGVKPIGRLINWAVTGCDPKVMGIGPAPAIRKLMEKAEFKLDQIDFFEVNEAFAPQYLAVEKELKLPREKTNVDGGAIAVGHPLAASGARITTHLLYELKRRGAKYGVGSACIGGGQGIAVLVEAL